MKKLEQSGEWNLGFPEWGLDLPVWNLNLPVWDLDLPNFEEINFNLDWLYP